MSKPKSKLEPIIEQCAPRTTPQYQGYIKKSVIKVLNEIKAQLKNPDLIKKLEDYIT